MLTYTSDELQTLISDRPPPCIVCKTLFTLWLWQPAQQRRAVRAQVGIPRDRANVGHWGSRSADCSLSVGWLNAQSMRNKTDALLMTITELDVLALTETRHISSTDTSLKSVTPESYAVLEVARPSGRGGGVAIIYRKHLKSSLVVVVVIARRVVSLRQLSRLRKSATAAGSSHRSCVVSCVGLLGQLKRCSMECGATPHCGQTSDMPLAMRAL